MIRPMPPLGPVTRQMLPQPPERRELALRAALQLVYPVCCPYCGRPQGSLPTCPDCEVELHALKRTAKRLKPENHYLGRLDGAAAVYRYDGCARQAVHRMKFQNGAWAAYPLGLCMAGDLFGCTFQRRYGILYPEPNTVYAMQWDLIVPVPATDAARGYNVPLQLAVPLGQGLGLPVLPYLLRRIRTEHHQVELSGLLRLENAAGAFAAVPGAHQFLEGKHVLLVDDVITTGATAAACAQALLAAGAESVFAAALCVSEPEKKHKPETGGKSAGPLFG